MLKLCSFHKSQEFNVLKYAETDKATPKGGTVTMGMMWQAFCMQGMAVK
jgi:hypothetical protein